MDSGDEKLEALEDALKGFLEAINPVEGTVEPIVPDAVIDQVTGLVDRLEKKLKHINLLLQSQIDDDQRRVLFESFYGDFIATLERLSQELEGDLLKRAQEMLEYAKLQLDLLNPIVDRFDSDEDLYVHSDSDIDVGRKRMMHGRKRVLRAYKLRF